MRQLQLRVKELEWERSTLQNEIDSAQNNNIDYSSASDDQPRKEVFDAVKVLYCFFINSNEKSKVVV